MVNTVKTPHPETDKHTPLKICHVISGLGSGGSEMALFRLLKYSATEQFKPLVISLGGEGIMGQKIAGLGIEVECYDLHRVLGLPAAFQHLCQRLADCDPDIVQTWMYHADLIGGIAARICTHAQLVWGIRNSTLDNQRSKITTRWVVRICAALSGCLPYAIVSCSQTAAEIHKRIGYSPSKFIIIPNGFDLDAFHPNPNARVSLRTELGLPGDAIVLGMIARFDPQKDHKTLFRALQQLISHQVGIHCVLCGDQVVPYNPALIAWLEEFGIQDRVHLLGRREDIPRITAGLDIAVLSSAYGEAFPNVIGEAMACAVPCVVTAVGDSAEIVGATGRVVPAQDPSRLADALLELVQMPESERRTLGIAARERIASLFRIQATTEKYAQLYQQLTRRS